jgi:uncharacterized protein YdbL (DUF1318 family)
MDTSRFEFRLSAGRRRELAALAAETGISSADLARLAIKQFLERLEIQGLRSADQGERVSR